MSPHMIMIIYALSMQSIYFNDVNNHSVNIIVYIMILHVNMVDDSDNSINNNDNNSKRKRIIMMMIMTL